MKMRIASSAALIMLMAAAASPGQTKEWDRRFGGAGDEYCGDVVPTRDGGYLLAGSSTSGADGDKTEASRGGSDFWIVRLDATGTKLWDRRFGGAENEGCGAVQETADGGFILGGGTSSGAGGDKTEGARGPIDYWIVKVDGAGAKQWDKRFGGTAYDELAQVKPTADGGYLVAGNSSSGAGGDRTQSSRGDVDYWVVKTDAGGAKQWDRRFGGARADFCEDFVQTVDGGFLLAGSSYSGAGGDRSQTARGGYDYWIVKIAANGGKQWDRRFGGSGDDRLQVVLGTADGGFLLGGISDSGVGGDRTEDSRGGSDYWIVKVDATGRKQWDKRFGGAQDDILTAMRQTTEGGYWLAGTSHSAAGGDRTEDSRGGADYWIVKVDGAGRKQWDKRFGGAADDMLDGLQQTWDGSLVVAGSSLSGAGGDKTEDTRGGVDFWMVRLVAPDRYEPDNSRATASVFPNRAAQTRSLHQPGDVDWSRFQVRTGGARQVRLTSTYDTQLALIRGRDGQVIGYDDPVSGPPGFDSVITRDSLAPGTYYIRVQKHGGPGLLPWYRLAARWTQLVPADRYEPDNSRGAAKTIRNGQTQRRTIHKAGNRDWAKFTVAAGGARNVLIETRGSSGDTELFLYDGSGRRLAYDDDSGPGRFSRLRGSSLPAGTYYIRVQEKGNNGTIAAYTLKARWTAR